MKKKFNGYLLMITILILALSCGENETADHQDEDEHGHEPAHEIVEISEAEMREFGIETEIAGPGQLQLHVVLPGEIVIPPDNLAHILPRFTGVVKTVKKNVGDLVKKGEVLAVIESNESLSNFEIKSLITGVVIEKHLTNGEVINDTDHGFLIADLNTVWANLSIFQKDLPFVHPGQQVEISAGLGFSSITGTISYISPVINEETRTATARVELDNSSGDWRPGLFVNGKITTTSETVDILIPKTAIEMMDSREVIFVKMPEGFEPRAIHIGRTNDRNLEVLEGLKRGDIYVSQGGFTLKAELQKEEFGGGHGH
ncbi:MAG: HlyD family efflux transporter periplasmic adaptor subunit [FCB group bacterium]|nr:HlyD family efflux transporter periplasmic adaptor subunit [FCB group bacterium]